MREIKFRGWDRVKGNLMYDFLLDSNGKAQIYQGISGRYEETDRIEIMQYTGLKDKNGKEIYEGDILTYNGITSNGNKIIREVNYNAENARFQSGMYLLTQSIELSEIIGNIYENPDLTQTTS